MNGEQCETWFYVHLDSQHLADAVGRISSRSFILAFKRAAEHTEKRYQLHPTALHYEAIQQGVTAASEIRIEEIKEDYRGLPLG